MKTLFILLSMTVLAHFAFAQKSGNKITGTIFKYNQSEPFAGVKVEAVDNPSIFELTDKIGAFEILLPESTDSIRISSKGYRTETYSIKDIGRIGNITLRKEWSVKGYLTNEERERLPDVNIILKDTKAESFTYAGKTDSTGFFHLFLTDDYTHLTFINDAYFPSDTFHLTPLLNYNVDELRPLEVKLLKRPVPFFDYSISTGLKTEQKISQTPASVVLITQREIGEYGFKTLDEILQYVTGLYLFDDYNWTGGGPVIGVRGFFSEGFNNNIIILVNGVNQYEDYWSNYPLSRIAVPVRAIDRIEIVRGPMSVIYGSGAFFGAINIITNQKTKTNNGLVSVSYGSLNTKKLSSYFKGTAGKLDISFAGSISSTGGLDEPFSDFTSKYSGNMTTKGLLQQNNNYFTLSSNYLINDKVKVGLELNTTGAQNEIFESTTSSSSACSCPIPQQDSAAIGAQAGLNASYVSITYSHKWSELLLVQSKFGYFSYRSSTDYTRGGNRYGFSTYSSQAVEGDISAFINPFRFFSLVTGISVREGLDLNSTFDIPGDDLLDGNNFRRLGDMDHLWLISGYIQGEYRLGERINAIAGMRLENLNDFSIESNETLTQPSSSVPPTISTNIHTGAPVLTPRGALLYNFNDNNVLKLLYGQATKRPSFGNYTDAATLRPSRIRTFELNYISEVSTLLLLNASIYYNQLDKLINRFSSVDQNANSVYRSDNTGTIRTQGAELGAQFNTANGKLKFDLSGSVNISTDHTGYQGYRPSQIKDLVSIKPDAELAYSPKWLAYGKVSWSIKPGLTLAAYSRYIPKVYPAISTSDLFENSEVKRIGNTLNGYPLINLNLQIQKLTIFQKPGYKESVLDKIYLNINVSNLFNNDVRYPTTGNNAAWADKGSPGFGTTILLTAGYNFSERSVK